MLSADRYLVQAADACHRTPSMSPIINSVCATGRYSAISLSLVDLV